jgi:HEAT repeat protein
VPTLRRLLNDPVFSVRLKAAGALFRLNDSSGLALLNEVSQSEHAGVRLAAAREMASQPDSTWQSLIRSLTEDPDPSIRVEAAKLLAPYDPSTASEVLHQLMRDDNFAIREAAKQAFLDRAVTDFAALRAVLLSGDPGMRVAASARILELTR